MIFIQKILTKLKDKYTWLLALLALTALYHLPYFNRFAPITEGWFHTYASAVAEGKVPYRDFYFFITPLYLYFFVGFIKVFGGGFIVARIYGIFERVFLTATLYTILTKYFKPLIVAFACFSAFILYSNHNADIIYSYYQTATLFSLFSVLFLSRYKLSDPFKKRLLVLIAAGIFAALSFLTKQNTGVFTFTLIVSYLFLFLIRQKPAAIPFAFAYALLPALSIIAIAAAFLYRYQALAPCIEQIFAGGIASKGSLLKVLTGFYKTTFTVAQVLLFTALISLWFFLKHMPKAIEIKLHPVREKLYLPFFAASCALISASVCYANLFLVKIVLIHFIFYTSFLIGLWYAAAALRRKLSGRESFYLLLCGAAFALMYSHGLSGTMEDHSGLLGGSFLICLMLTTKIQFNKAKNAALIIFFCVFSLFSIVERYTHPYEWWGDKQDAVSMAVAAVPMPVYKNIKMSSVTAYRYMEINSLIKRNLTSPEDKIYISQHLTGLYYVAGKIPFTFAYADYFDVCSDTCARLNAEAIQKEKPKMIIYMDFPGYIWEEHEKLFRNGHPSGQREIRQTIFNMASGYRLIKTYNEDKSVLDDFTLYIWVRKTPSGK